MCRYSFCLYVRNFFCACRLEYFNDFIRCVKFVGVSLVRIFVTPLIRGAQEKVSRASHAKARGNRRRRRDAQYTRRALRNIRFTGAVDCKKRKGNRWDRDYIVVAPKQRPTPRSLHRRSSGRSNKRCNFTSSNLVRFRATIGGVHHVYEQRKRGGSSECKRRRSIRMNYPTYARRQIQRPSYEGKNFDNVYRPVCAAPFKTLENFWR